MGRISNYNVRLIAWYVDLLQSSVPTTIVISHCQWGGEMKFQVYHGVAAWNVTHSLEVIIPKCVTYFKLLIRIILILVVRYWYCRLLYVFLYYVTGDFIYCQLCGRETPAGMKKRRTEALKSKIDALKDGDAGESKS